MLSTPNYTVPPTFDTKANPSMTIYSPLVAVDDADAHLNVKLSSGKNVVEMCQQFGSNKFGKMKARLYLTDETCGAVGDICVKVMEQLKKTQPELTCKDPIWHNQLEFGLSRDKKFKVLSQATFTEKEVTVDEFNKLCTSPEDKHYVLAVSVWHKDGRVGLFFQLVRLIVA